MPGAFDASPEFDFDPLRTEEEIQARGPEVLTWLRALATSDRPPLVDIHLVREIHRRWFESTFPFDAGVERTQMVVNRKGSAVEKESIVPAVVAACGNWEFRRQYAPDDDLELVPFIVEEANTLTVAVYDVHPFIDGNTRTTWHLRNYILMLGGLRPLIDLPDERAYEDAWWEASPHEHAALDEIVVQALAAGDR